MSRLKADKLIRLEQVWYKKLKQSGFEDIEDTSNHHRRLKSWHSFKYQNMDETNIQVIKLYYERAIELLNSYRFLNWEHREIWKLHCDGFSERDIVIEFPKYKKSMVHYLIRKLRKQINWAPQS